MEILLNFVIALISILITWWITYCYYKKSLIQQEEHFSCILSKVDKKSGLDEIKYENRIQQAVNDYRKKGTPKFIIDTFSDLSDEEKSKMYDDVIVRMKGRKGKNNPYRN